MMDKRIRRYIREYQWSNVFAMIRNNRLTPKECLADCQNKLVVITGATSGIGYITARKYAAHGANLLCVNRNPQKSEALRNEIESEFGVQCDYRIADLGSIKEIFKVSNELSQWPTPIDVLIHNAGNYLTKKEITPDGFEKVFVVHYLSSFIMNYLLMEKLKAQELARIIMVGSEGYRFAVWGLRLDDLKWEKRKYSGMRSYGSAKMAQLLSMIVFNELFTSTGVTINTMHPGAVKTGTGVENGKVYRFFKKHFFDKMLKSPDISAEALYYLGVSQEIDGVSGNFFNLTTREELTPPALDQAAARELWDQTLEMTGVEELKR